MVATYIQGWRTRRLRRLIQSKVLYIDSVSLSAYRMNHAMKVVCGEGCRSNRPWRDALSRIAKQQTWLGVAASSRFTLPLHRLCYLFNIILQHTWHSTLGDERGFHITTWSARNCKHVWRIRSNHSWTATKAKQTTFHSSIVQYAAAATMPALT